MSDWEKWYLFIAARKNWRCRKPYGVFFSTEIVDKITPFGTYLFIIGDRAWDEISVKRKAWNSIYGVTRYRRRK